MPRRYNRANTDSWATRSMNIVSNEDEIRALIMTHTNAATRGSGRGSVDNILKFITLVANGTSMAAAARMCRLSYNTVNAWKNGHMGWLNQALDRARELLDQELDTRYTGIISKAADVTLDRLENGDCTLDKNGNVVRKPVSAKDAAIVGSIHFDKRNILRGKPTSISENKTSEQRLKELGEQFKKFAQATEINDADYEVENE